MAGGTGGHIFPGLAVAEELRARGWRVHWLGAPGSMESRIVPQHGFALELIDFSACAARGSSRWPAAAAPAARVLAGAAGRAPRQARRGGGPGRLHHLPGRDDGRAAGKPLVLHEQNSVAGMANKVLAGGRPGVHRLPQRVQEGPVGGQPLRAAFTRQAAPAERFAGRTGPLRLLVVGGSLGARRSTRSCPRRWP